MAEELAQETMLTVWRKADSFVPRSIGVAAWIYGAGTDAMSGGAGDDTFVFSATGFGDDTINDFNPTEDVLQFSPSLFANYRRL